MVANIKNRSQNRPTPPIFAIQGSQMLAKYLDSHLQHETNFRFHMAKTTCTIYKTIWYLFRRG